MSRISAIQVAEEASDWKIYFELEINQAPAALPWIYPDGQSVFSAHEDVLKLCPANDRNNLADIANSVIKEEPSSYPIFADALDETLDRLHEQMKVTHLVGQAIDIGQQRTLNEDHLLTFKFEHAYVQ